MRVKKGWLIRGSALVPAKTRSRWVKAYVAHTDRYDYSWIGPALTKRGWTPLLVAAYIELELSIQFWGRIPYPVEKSSVENYRRTLWFGKYLTETIPWPEVWSALVDGDPELPQKLETQAFGLTEANPPFQKLYEGLTKKVKGMTEGEKFDLGEFQREC